MGINKPSFFDDYKKQIDRLIKNTGLTEIYAEVLNSLPAKIKKPSIAAFYKWVKTTYPKLRKPKKVQTVTATEKTIRTITIDTDTKDELEDLKKKWRITDDNAFEILCKQKQALDEIWAYKEDYYDDMIDTRIKNKIGFLSSFINICDKVTSSLHKMTGGKAFYIPETEESGELSKQVEQETIKQIAKLEAAFTQDDNIKDVIEIEAKEVRKK